MKKIHLVNITLPDKNSFLTSRRKSTVSLGNDLSLIFSSIKAASSFLAYVNTELNFIALVLNELYIEVFSHSRRLWLSLDGRYSDERQIKDGFKSFEASFNMAYSRCESPNGNTFTFRHLYAAIDDLIKVVDLLVYLQGERGNYTEKKVLQALIYRLNLVKNDLDKLGKDKVLSE